MAAYTNVPNLYAAPVADDPAKRGAQALAQLSQRAALTGAVPRTVVNPPTPYASAVADVNAPLNAPDKAPIRGALMGQAPVGDQAFNVSTGPATGNSFLPPDLQQAVFDAKNPQTNAFLAANPSGSNTGAPAPAGAAPGNGSPYSNITSAPAVQSMLSIGADANAYAQGRSQAAQQAAQGVLGTTAAMANTFNGQANRAVPQVSVLNGADPTAQQGSALQTLRGANPAASAQGALASANALRPDAQANAAFREAQASSPGDQAQQAVNSLAQLQPTQQLQQTYGAVQAASPTAEAQTTLGRLRAFDPTQVPSAAQAQLADQASQDFANTLALARSGGTASDRAWNMRAAEAQNFERSNQLGRTMAGLRAQEATAQQGQKLSALGTEASLAAGIGGLDINKLGLQANTAQGIGGLQLQQGIAGVQGAQGVGELAVQRLNAMNSAAGTAGQLQVAGNANQIAAAQNVGALQLGQSGQVLNAAQGVDTTRLNAGQAQASTDVQLQELADRYQLGSQQLGANTYLQGAQLAQAGNAQASNLGLTGQQIQYGAYSDANAANEAAAQRTMADFYASQGLALQQQARQDSQNALPWQVAAGVVGAAIPAAMALSDPRSKDSVSGLPEADVQRIYQASLVTSDKRSKTALEKVHELAAEAVEKSPGYKWKYKPGFGENPEIEYAGPMADALQKTRFGKGLVQDDGKGGLKRVRTDRLSLLHHAALGSVMKRLRQLEAA